MSEPAPTIVFIVPATSPAAMMMSASSNDMGASTTGKSRVPRRRQGAERPVDYEPS